MFTITGSMGSRGRRRSSLSQRASLSVSLEFLVPFSPFPLLSLSLAGADPHWFTPRMTTGAGAPQKVMWMARSKWNDKENKNVDVEFISGMVCPCSSHTSLFPFILSLLVLDSRPDYPLLTAYPVLPLLSSPPCLPSPNTPKPSPPSPPNVPSRRCSPTTSSPSPTPPEPPPSPPPKAPPLPPSRNHSTSSTSFLPKARSMPSRPPRSPTPTVGSPSTRARFSTTSSRMCLPSGTARVCRRARRPRR
jgi:hypothetical protein